MMPSSPYPSTQLPISFLVEESPISFYISLGKNKYQSKNINKKLLLPVGAPMGKRLPSGPSMALSPLEQDRSNKKYYSANKVLSQS
jgi:hypothetical protein